MIKKIFKSESTSSHFLFPKDSENPKSFDIGLWKGGAKICLNGVKNEEKKSVKNLFHRRDFTPFMSKKILI